ncbi:MAG TPA: L-seryl-tRNA(Sec) selenium transferase [Anaerolineaceae bacterium]|nr:L-seryl-tRNA(Sec) selenium transferase [Anaerolineaceae bacterium]
MSLRSLPSVDQLLKTRQAAEMIAEFGRPLTLEAIRMALAEIREAHLKVTPPPAAQGEEVPTSPILPGREVILGRAHEILTGWLMPTLIPVINATGVVLHTNLGRAPLSRSSLEAIQNLIGGYNTLEYDLKRGMRGLRWEHAENLLTRLTGAEAALVVNNNAAAVLLVLSALARRHRVIISRTQLVEVGGGFRIPDVMSQSGARLVEVGATNRVHLSDYELALQEPTALVMRAHHSNYRIMGFTSEPTLAEMADLAHRAGVPLVDDLGSGALLDTSRFGLDHEPTVQESILAGADLVCFSGDKLLGGPQAGIIVGRKDMLEKIKRHPLARAVRADKLCLAALTATLMHYLKDEVEREVPIWQMMVRTPEQLQARARRWAEVLGRGNVIEGRSAVGGGSLPEATLPTYLYALPVVQPDRLLTQLRRGNPPIIARIEEDMVVLDPRTVLADQEGALLVALQNAIAESTR